MSAKGSLWSTAELQCLLEIWADQSTQEQLDKSYRNSDTYGRIRDYLLTRGYWRTTEQCRDKVKKLRSHYLKIRNALRKSETSARGKDQFPWYEAVDKIIGLKANCKPHVLESHSDKAAEIRSEASRSVISLTSHLSHTAEETHANTSDTEGRLAGAAEGRLAGAAEGRPAQQRKKRKLKTDVSDMMVTFLDIQKKRHDEFMRAEQLRRQQQMEMFNKWMKTQVEMEERRQQAQREECQEVNRMFQHMMSRFFHHRHWKPPKVVLKDEVTQEGAGVQDVSKDQIQVLGFCSLDQDTQKPRCIKEEQEDSDIAKLDGGAEPRTINLTQDVKTEPKLERVSDHPLGPHTIHPACKEEEHAHYQDWIFSLEQKDTRFPHIKEEPEELWTSQEVELHQGPEEAEITMFPSATASVKIEEERPHQTETSREAEPETKGGGHGRPEPATIWDPDTNDTSSDCSEPEVAFTDEDWMENSDLRLGLFPLTDGDVPSDSSVFASWPTSGPASDQVDHSGSSVDRQ